MATALPLLETERLIIRPYTLDDLAEVHRVISAAWGVPIEEREGCLAKRERWLRWTVAGYNELANLDQPPYGDRAVMLRENGALIGSVGLVPALGPFRQLAGWGERDGSRRWFPEVGLYWAIDPAQQGCGYATEAARGLVDRAFAQFNLARIIATTEYTNAASIGVMRKLGMRILHNSLPQPEWFQVVGVLDNPA